MQVQQYQGGEEEVGASGVPILRFGVFELDLKGGQLRKAGVLVKLQPQPFRVLALLASHASEVVTREEIQQQIWGNDTFVDFERGLNFCVRQIRDALADDAETPRYVETLPKRGYRFIHPVERLGSRPAQDGADERKLLTVDINLAWLAVLVLVVAAVAYTGYWTWQRWWTPAEKVMLVVLPFDNLSDDPQQGYFSDGLTEEMITQLGRLQPARLGVIARTTSDKMRGKSIDEIQRELGVDYVLEGSVRRAGNQLAITAQLIQVTDRTQLWAESYERKLADVLAIQREVAKRVASSLDLILLPAERAELTRQSPVNPEAFDAYLKGRFYWNKRDLARGIVFFEQAIAIDPDYASAYAGLANTYALLGSTPYDVLAPQEAVPKQKEMAERALALDRSLAEAHAALAHAALFYDWNWGKAEAAFLSALEHNPNYATAHQWYADYLWVAGRPDEAFTHLQRALELDPASIVIRLSIGRHYYLLRQYNEALSRFQETIEMDPNFFLGHFDLGLVYVQIGRYEDAIAEMQMAVRLLPGSPFCLAALGYAYGYGGRDADARRVLGQLEDLSRDQPVQPLYVASVYTSMGENDLAFEWLDHALRERSTFLSFVTIEPLFDPLRSDPRFQTLLRRMNFPE